MLYSLGWWFGLPLALAYLVWRARRQPEYLHHVRERLGWAPPARPTDRPLIWIHAVSVGESRAALPLVQALAQAYPAVHVLITAMTPTGRETARALYAPVLGHRLHQAWLPWDLPGAQRRFLSHWKPAFGVLMETELWPNLMKAARQTGVPVALINARLSQRSLRKGLRFKALITPAAQSLSLVLAQTQDDARRMAILGRSADAITGNLKFDNAPDPERMAQGQRWREQIGRRVVLFASSREGEEALLLAHWPRQTDLLLVIVPRHPQRFDEVARLIQQDGRVLSRRLALDEVHADFSVVDVLLGDSMGEMDAWYALADVVIMGGSLGPYGSQNLIEPCAVGCPVLLGPNTWNFAEAAQGALDAGAAHSVSQDSAASAAVALMADASTRAGMRQAALAFAAHHRGALARSLSAMSPLTQRLGQPLPGAGLPRVQRGAPGVDERPPRTPPAAG